LPIITLAPVNLISLYHRENVKYATAFIFDRCYYLLPLVAFTFYLKLTISGQQGADIFRLNIIRKVKFGSMQQLNAEIIQTSYTLTKEVN